MLSPEAIDARLGVGLRNAHIDEWLTQRPTIGWLEVHSENWMCERGPVAETLAQICQHYPLSLHGVGLSLGSVDTPEPTHLRKLQSLVARTQAILVSEHLSWSRLGAQHTNDLLPLPYTEEAVATLARNIDCVQQALGRRILVENVSSYCTFAESSMPEWEFVNAVVERSDCGLLLDLNNVYVNAINHGFSASDYLRQMPWHRVAELHLAGYENEGNALIDTHGRAVQAPVWDLFEHCIPSIPSDARLLIEWDQNLPVLATLLAEAEKAGRRWREARSVAA